MGFELVWVCPVLCSRQPSVIGHRWRRCRWCGRWWLPGDTFCFDCRFESYEGELYREAELKSIYGRVSIESERMMHLAVEKKAGEVPALLTLAAITARSCGDWGPSKRRSRQKIVQSMAGTLYLMR